MTTEKEFVVVVKRGVDLDAFDAEMSASQGHGPIPSRSVDIADPRPGSKRMTHWMLTEEEANELKNDPRVLDVDIPVDKRDDIEKILNLTQTFDFEKTTVADSTKANWGLRRCIEETNVYENNSTPPDNFYPYGLDGTDVDVVIQDTGTSSDHPEWEDRNGLSRFKEIDWYAESGLPGFQPSGFYIDYHGHGTHCAGISAGKTYGWAKNANIYAVKVQGLEGPSDPNGGISTSDCFDVIRLWHLNKTSGLPTVVNMSWGYGRTITTTNPDGGVYRGTPWGWGIDYNTQNGLWAATGVVPQLSDGFTSFRRIPVRLAQIDAEVEDMIDAGIHVCIAAGNQYYKIDVSTGSDYDNYVTFGGQDTYYHRGSSPYSDSAFIVGNIDSNTELDGDINRDKTAGSSNKGPGVNIWAPGTDIISAASNINVFGSSTGNYFDASYRIANIGGTSMAAPQVAGLIALHLQVDPNATPEQIKNKLIAESKDVIYSTGSDTDYEQFETSILGSPNRMLFSKYGKQPLEISGQLSLSTTIPLYYLSQDSDAVDEGETIRYNLRTVNIAAGTAVPFSILDITTDDISSIKQWEERYTSNQYEVLRTLTGSSAVGQRYRYRMKWNSILVGDFFSDTAFAEGGLLQSTDGNTYRFGAEISESGDTRIFSITKVNTISVSLSDNFYIGYSSKGVIEIDIAEDATTEGSEQIRINLNGTSVTTSAVTINDTSINPTYSLVATPSAVSEGDSFTVTLTTTNLSDGTNVPYTISGSGITAGDFSSGLISGNFVISSNSASLDFTLAEDLTTEGLESIILTLDNDGDSVTVNVTDSSTTPINPTYTTFVADSETINEGDSVTFTLNTSQIADGTTVGYTISGVSVDDIDAVSLTGSLTLAANTAEFTITLNEDVTTEGTETLTVTLDATDSNGNSTSELSDSVIVTDSSTTPPTYTLTAVDSVDEGDTLVITLDTTDVADGTNIDYTITGVDTNDIDIELTGSFNITSNQDTLTINVTNDAVTEGNETLILTLDGLGESVNVIINDTSITGTPTYILSASATTVNEGDSVQILLNTSNVSEGATIPYTITGINASDLSSGSITGNFTVNSNFSSLSFTFAQDITTEGNEVMNLALDNGSDDIDITILDTSIGPTYTLSASSTNINEGDTVNITLDTTSLSNGTNVPYTITGISGDDLSSGTITGNFILNSNTDTLSFTLSEDLTTEGIETLTLSLDNGQDSIEITVNDTSQPVSYDSIDASSAEISEGESVTFTINTSNVSDGTTVGYSISGVTTDDISGSTLGGTVTINSNTGSITITTIQDSETEGNETLTVTLASTDSGGNSTGSISDSVIILDTSVAPDYVINVTANNAQNYTLSGSDASGSVNGNDPSLTFNVGDYIEFSVNAIGHPFYIKTVQGSGTGNQAAGVENAGETQGSVYWTPATPGTYYYQCSVHNNMFGEITIN